MDISDPQTDFLQTNIAKRFLATTAIMAIVYFFLLAFWFPKGYAPLFYLLMAGEVFHLWQVLGYLYTIWNTNSTFPVDPLLRPVVDVFITVAGEPVEIVRQTALAALHMNYPQAPHLFIKRRVCRKKR